MSIHTISTPAALIDVTRMRANIARMQQRMDSLGVAFRPHVKTAKCLPSTAMQREAGARGITVSTLKEAEQFFSAGYNDIIYAVGIAPTKLPQVLDLMHRGCDLKIITDSVEGAKGIAAFASANNASFSVLIEIDTDGHRSGMAPTAALLPDVASVLVQGGCKLYGVLAHAGGSYQLHDAEALERMAEQERAGCVRAAHRLRQAGFDCPCVSVGSTPTALSAKHLDGVTEVRAGVYLFFDLVMRNIGVCSFDDIALSVLTTVIGHQKEKGWAIVDAGWMAMSRDRGTASQLQDFGYGQVCDASGAVIPGYIMNGANQEHGIICCPEAPDPKIAEHFPLGTLLRILPNHACPTAAQFPEYHALDAHGDITVWPRFYGW